MKPQGILTEQDYQSLASELIDYHDPDNFLDNCEQQYMATNRGFYEHLLKAVTGLIFSESALRQTDIVLIPPPDNAETEKAVEVVKRRAELAKQKGLIPFDITNLQFIVRDKKDITEILSGKTPYYVCCDDTVECLEGLVPYNPDERDFTFFVNTFSKPHQFGIGLILPKIIKDPAKLEYYFQKMEEKVQEITRRDLREYFFRCVEIDVNWNIHKDTTGEARFGYLKFGERLEQVKQKVLNHNKNEIPETENKVKNSDFTTARQVLAVHYLLEYCQIRGVDQTEKAKFIQLLTGKSFKNIYDLVRSPLATKQGTFRRADLQFIRPYFENLGLTEIVKMINNQLDKPDL